MIYSGQHSANINPRIIPSSGVRSVKLLAGGYLTRLRISELPPVQEAIPDGRQLALLLARIYTKPLETMQLKKACRAAAFPFSPGTPAPFYWCVNKSKLGAR